MVDEERKLTEEAGREQADHTLKMAQLQLAADKMAASLKMTQYRMTADASGCGGSEGRQC